MARQFGSVKQLPSGRWQASFPDPNTAPGTRGRILAPTTYPDEKSARKWLAVQVGKVIEGTWKPPVVAKVAAPMFTEYANQYIAERRIKKTKAPLAPKTRQQYDWLMTTYLIPEFGKQRLDQITPTQVKSWIAKVSDAPTSGAQAYSLLASVMRQAANHDVIVKTPCREDGAGTSPKRKKTITVLTVAELNALAAKMPEKYRAPTLLMTWGVLRWSEISGLQRRDIDGTTVHIRRTVVRLAATPLKPEDRTKSEAGGRPVYVPPGCAAALQKHLDAFVGSGPESLLMTATNGGPLSVTTYVKALTKAAADIGHPELSCHMLRHTGNTWMRDDGASDAERMVQAGHTTMAVNAIYTHETEERLTTLAERRAAREAKATG